MSESHRHKRLCELLYQILRAALGDEASVGADQFVYFDASSAQRKCSPDSFVKLAVPAESIEVWKTWEKGVPELCVEILSPSDDPGKSPTGDTKEKLTLPEKLRRFHTMGVKEIITFDVDAPAGSRIRAWDLIHGDLIERAVENERTRCFTLGSGAHGEPRWFVVAPYEAEGRAAVDRLEAALRLAEEVSGGSSSCRPRTSGIGRCLLRNALASHKSRLASPTNERTPSRSGRAPSGQSSTPNRSEPAPKRRSPQQGPRRRKSHGFVRSSSDAELGRRARATPRSERSTASPARERKWLSPKDEAGVLGAAGANFGHEDMDRRALHGAPHDTRGRVHANGG